MDAYLESLVLKTEMDSEKVGQPTGEVADGIEVELGETGVISADNETEISNKENSNEEKEPIEKQESQPAATESSSYTVGQTYFVNNIRVYRSPDTKQIAKVITGNVIYKGVVNGFNAIEYMKHGFGMVKGYTLSDLC